MTALFNLIPYQLSQLLGERGECCLKKKPKNIYIYKQLPRLYPRSTFAKPLYNYVKKKSCSVKDGLDI